MESVDFHQPIPRGNAALIQSYVYAAGTTSVSVYLRVFSEDPLSGERKLTTESHFVYVAVDEDGSPTPVPELDSSSERATELKTAADGDGDVPTVDKQWSE
jgi:acyl-CoA hydrolase